MKTFLYVLAAIGSIVGGFFLFMALTVADSAPQEASLAAIAVAFSVLPYVFARAVDLGGSASIANDVRIIAQHYARIEEESARGRVKRVQQGGTGSPFSSMGNRAT